MRQLLWGALIFGLATGAAVAQSALEGPLAAPDAAAPKAKPPAHHRKPTKTAHAAKAAASAAEQPSFGGKGAAPVDPTISKATTPNDPLSFGMKWNGNNDDARETRIQNYNGDAQGTGAEVGMKLHF